MHGAQNRKSKTVRKEMIGKRDKFSGSSEKQSALELRWRVCHFHWQNSNVCVDCVPFPYQL